MNKNHALEPDHTERLLRWHGVLFLPLFFHPLGELVYQLSWPRGLLSTKVSNTKHPLQSPSLSSHLLPCLPKFSLKNDGSWDSFYSCACFYWVFIIKYTQHRIYHWTTCSCTIWWREVQWQCCTTIRFQNFDHPKYILCPNTWTPGNI